MTLEEELNLVDSIKQQPDLSGPMFARLYDYYFDKIFLYCKHRLNSRELAEDIASYVFMKAVEEIYKFDTRKGIRFSSWLYRTAQNKIIDTYRKAGKNKIVELIENNEPSVNNVSESISVDQKKKEIALTLLELNDRYQEIISLRFTAELELDEIAQVLKIKKNNVSVLLTRALEAFRKKFKEKFPESEIFDSY